jgi:hypothetical protein
MQKLAPSVIIILSLVCAYACRHPAEEAVPAGDTLFYIMAGQSNMAGRGTVEPADAVINPCLLEMDDATHYALKHEPNTIYQGSLAGLDCGLSFGNEVLLYLPSGTKLCLIQCSISSTSIQEWLGDSLHVVHLYSNMLSRAHAAMHSGTLKGVLWMQGETNAENAQAARDYGADLHLFISDFRRDVGISDLPFFVGLLPSWCNRVYRDSVNAGIRSAEASLSGVHLVNTDKLTMKGDSLHFDAAGQRELGALFAKEAIKAL